ncbi:hypothetical protein N7512_007141 [Penicillium capsulatum]|nr:hypothetical protein N7512_007141 [Penicillium capsulatum]
MLRTESTTSLEEEKSRHWDQKISAKQEGPEKRAMGLLSKANAEERSLGKQQHDELNRAPPDRPPDKKRKIRRVPSHPTCLKALEIHAASWTGETGDGAGIHEKATRAGSHVEAANQMKPRARPIRPNSGLEWK